MSRGASRRRDWLRPALAAAGVALIPFLRTLASGESFFFRDITRTFFPIKRYVAEGLRQGEVRFWNPLLHEGVPLHLGPLGYPIDLLHALWVDERFFSLLLALHVPIGAAAFTLLARRLGCGSVAAAGGAVLYALGGFSLSSLNLYVYAQAMAWAPLVALGLMAAAERGGRAIALAAGAVYLCAATSGVEVFGQAVLLGLVLAASGENRARRSLRSVAAVALGLSLAAPGLLLSWAQLRGSARAAGLPPAVVVAHSIDPWTLPQVLVGNWHGDLLDVANRWWGANFFPLGFPYFVSLYLGATAFALAAAGACCQSPYRRRLVLLALLALAIALGRFVGLQAVVEAVPPLRVLRFPVKAFFSVHACVALLAALGLEALASDVRAWRRAAAIAALLGGLLVALRALPSLAPGTWLWFLRGFMPPEHPLEIRHWNGEALLADAARGGLLAVGLAGVAVAVLRGRLLPPRGACLAAALLAADLLRAGAGLNPSVSSSFYRLSPEMEKVAAPLRASGARVFSCDPESSPAYFAARRAVAEHDAWSFAVSMETLTPNLNVGLGVRTALSRDLTMMVPERRVLLPEETAPSAVPRLVERLRAAGVARVLCVDAVVGPGLREIATLLPRRIAPLPIHVYEIEDPLPLRSLAGGRIVSAVERANRLDFEVEAPAATTLVVRDAWAPGWSARVDGADAALRRVEDHYRAVDVGPGTARVSLRYHPPGLAAGLAVAFAGLVLVALVVARD